MSFDKGTVNFTVLAPARKIESLSSVIDDIMGEGYKQSSPSFETDIFDSTSGLSLADIVGREVMEGDFKYGGIPYFAIRKREKKIDTGLVKERLERFIADAAQEGRVVSSKEKKAQKEVIVNSLAMDAQEKISGNRVVISPDGSTIYLEASSEKKVEELVEILMSLIEYGKIGGGIGVVTPEFMATTLGYDPDAYEPIRVSEHEQIMGIGEDFLTYLFMASEIKGYVDPFEISLPGNINMVDCCSASSGAKKISMKDGLASISKEVISALKSGKKVESADFMIAEGDAAFSVTIDSQFHFKKLKMENMEDQFDDKEGEFLARVNAITKFTGIVETLLKQFLDRRSVLENVFQEWVSKKDTFLNS